MEGKAVHLVIQGAFASIASNFIIDSLQLMIPWFIAMFCVIICDLITGVRKSKLMGEYVRFSRACRATMGKMVTYFSFVVMVVVVDKAAGGFIHIDTYACLFVCFIEGCSIVSNILRPKGYDLNLAAAIGVFAKKVFSVEKEDVNDIINKEEKINGKCE